jgi:hypothetical protein
MAMKERLRRDEPVELDVVALLTDLPEEGLMRARVGTVVERLDESTFLIGFSDDHRKMNALVACTLSQLLLLHYEPHAA